MAVAAKRTKTIMARRLDLIQGTIRSISTVGYNNSTVQSICDAAGLSRGLIGHYFKGKDDLLLEAFRFLVAQAEEHTRQSIRAVGNDPLQRLLAASDAAFARIGKDDETSRGMVWLACWGVSPWVPEMKSLQAKLWRRYRHWIEATMIQAAEERGVTVDARRASIMYSELINGLWIGWLLDNDAYTPEMAAGIVRDWVLDLFGEERSSRKLAGNGGKSASAKTKSKTPKANGNGRKGSGRKS
jgi:TetR/AcrR family transcriptional repressor of bet genes